MIHRLTWRERDKVECAPTVEQREYARGRHDAVVAHFETLSDSELRRLLCAPQVSRTAVV